MEKPYMFSCRTKVFGWLWLKSCSDDVRARLQESNHSTNLSKCFCQASIVEDLNCFTIRRPSNATIRACVGHELVGLQSGVRRNQKKEQRNKQIHAHLSKEFGNARRWLLLPHAGYPEVQSGTHLLVYIKGSLLPLSSLTHTCARRTPTTGDAQGAGRLLAVTFSLRTATQTCVTV